MKQKQTSTETLSKLLEQVPTDTLKAIVKSREGRKAKEDKKQKVLIWALSFMVLALCLYLWLFMYMLNDILHLF